MDLCRACIDMKQAVEIDDLYEYAINYNWIKDPEFPIDDLLGLSHTNCEFSNDNKQNKELFEVTEKYIKYKPMLNEGCPKCQNILVASDVLETKNSYLDLENGPWEDHSETCSFPYLFRMDEVMNNYPISTEIVRIIIKIYNHIAKKINLGNVVNHSWVDKILENLPKTIEKKLTLNMSIFQIFFPRHHLPHVPNIISPGENPFREMSQYLHNEEGRISCSKCNYFFVWFVPQSILFTIKYGIPHDYDVSLVAAYESGTISRLWLDEHLDVLESDIINYNHKDNSFTYNDDFISEDGHKREYNCIFKERLPTAWRKTEYIDIDEIDEWLRNIKYKNDLINDLRKETTWDWYLEKSLKDFVVLAAAATDETLLAASRDLISIIRGKTGNILQSDKKGEAKLNLCNELIDTLKLLIEYITKEDYSSPQKREEGLDAQFTTPHKQKEGLDAQFTTPKKQEEGLGAQFTTPKKTPRIKVETARKLLKYRTYNTRVQQSVQKSDLSRTVRPIEKEDELETRQDTVHRLFKNPRYNTRLQQSVQKGALSDSPIEEEDEFEIKKIEIPKFDLSLANNYLITELHITIDI
jgi:hypothetical protein